MSTMKAYVSEVSKDVLCRTNFCVIFLDKEPTRRGSHTKLNTMPLRDVCQYLTLIRVFK